LSVKRFEASNLRAIAARGGRGRGCVLFADPRYEAVWEASVLVDDGAAGAIRRNTERRRVLYDDGGAYDGALAVSAEGCTCITACGGWRSASRIN